MPRLPNLANQDFKVIGVPDIKDPTKLDADLGRGGIIRIPATTEPSKFRRCVTSKKTAPYMHNGIFHTLEDVLDFYSKGGGHALGVPNLDDKIRKFDLTESDRADLVAFMKSLTDESLTPKFRRRCPRVCRSCAPFSSRCRALCAAADSLASPSVVHPEPESL